MTFANDLRRFAKTAEQRVQAVRVGSAELAFESIVHGSPVTGAPGQPVAPSHAPTAGKLRDSWTLEYPEDNVALISTPVDYAPDVEENLRGVDFSNHGPHSVKLTAAGFGRIVERVAQGVTKGAP